MCVFSGQVSDPAVRLVLVGRWFALETTCVPTRRKGNTANVVVQGGSGSGEHGGRARVAVKAFGAVERSTLAVDNTKQKQKRAGMEVIL